jgi:sugar diacid utilization regulator
MVQCLLDGIPLNPHLQARLERAYSKQELICVLLEYIHNVPKVPISYVCNTVESTFPKSIAFEYKGAVIGLISAEIFQKDTGEQSNEMQERTMAVILSLGLRAGISDAFKEIVKVNIYYLQASAALANGAVLNPSKEYHEFSSYALNEMMINLSGQLPLEMYYSEGLRRLVEHDAVAKVSYLETLRIYLEENMGVQKAAQRLYIHRSTFLERFARIEKILDTNLKDPNERLRLQILLKAIQARDEILGGVK